MEREEGLVCVVCGDRIGFYEPIVALECTGGRKTSLAKEPDLPQQHPILLHTHCFPGQTPDEG